MTPLKTMKGTIRRNAPAQLAGFFLLTLILSVATVAGMVVFTWLTLAGMAKLKLQFIEKYERGILGGLLCVLGLLVIILEH